LEELGHPEFSMDFAPGKWACQRQETVAARFRGLRRLPRERRRGADRSRRRLSERRLGGPGNRLSRSGCPQPTLTRVGILAHVPAERNAKRAYKVAGGRHSALRAERPGLRLRPPRHRSRQICRLPCRKADGRRGDSAAGSVVGVRGILGGNAKMRVSRRSSSRVKSPPR
jgi:hypothetical protein